MTSHRRGWCRGLSVLLVLASTCLSAATRLPSFPEKPVDIDQTKWTALQNAVAATLPIPASTELTTSDGAAFDYFGVSVALSGTTALVGAYYKTIGSNDNQGAAYVFTFNGSTWIQQQELTASDGAAEDGFGWSVALSGTTVLVGAILHTVGSNAGQGAAYVFTFNGSKWVQQQELTASNGAAVDEFGTSVALSGTTGLVGAMENSIGSNQYQGAAYVFTFNGSKWVQQQELTASDGAANDNFGISVAQSGTTALVGAPYHAIGSNDTQGAAYVFTFNGSKWVQQQELTANDGAADDNFGISVALSGTTALVGAIGPNDAQGEAYVFTFNGSKWVQQQELTASDGAAGDYFGYSVALSGTTTLVGAILHTVNSNDSQGAAYVFTFNGSKWVQQQELTASNGVDCYYFGYSVALSGATVVVGAPFSDVGSNNNQGAAYVFNDDTIFCDGFDGTGICK